MRKVSALLLILFTSFFTAYSQTLEIDWGNFIETEKDFYYQKFLGFDADGFYVLKSDKITGCKNANVWLEYISRTMYTVESSNQLLMPSANGMETTFEDMFFIDGKFILFTSTVDPHRKQKISYIQYVNKDGTQKNMPKEIGQLPIQNGPFGFNYSVSDDGNKIMFNYHKFFTKYNNEEFVVKVFDASLKETFSKNLILPLAERTMEVFQYKLGNDGNIYMMAKLEPDGKRKGAATGPKEYDFSIIAYNVTRNDFYVQPILMKKNMIKSAMFNINKQNNIYVCGYFTNKTVRDGGILGMFYQVINPSIQKVIKGDAEDKDCWKLIERTDLDGFKSERFIGGDVKNEDYRYNYVLKDILFQENGGVVFLGEQMFVDTTKMTDPGSKEVTHIYYYHHNDILAAGISTSGKLDWYKRIPKEQYGIDDNAYYSSYRVNVAGNKIKILFNDNAGNVKLLGNTDKVKQFKNNVSTSPKGQSAIVTIYNDGSIDKSEMFNNADLKTIFVPAVFGELKDVLSIGGIKGKYIKFGTFYFE